jgi:chemotaxis methyl-accepting protein methylase
MNYKEFLKTTLPQLGLRWRRFNRKSIRKRVIARLQELNLHSLGEYHSYLLDNTEERRYLTSLLTVTISRFWRNASLFEALKDLWFPTLLSSLPAAEPLQIWSAGCASGEEPYSLLILWLESFAGSGREMRLLASDSNATCLERAQQAHYPASSFREMPIHLRQKYCTNEGGTFSLPHDFPNKITWVEHNLILDPPFPGNHLIFCRNLAYTYFTEPLQQEITHHFHESLLPGGLLVTGRKDSLPPGSDRLFRLGKHPFYERLSGIDK